ncbi:MAG TPA: hypothetical protein PLP23_22730 [Panacibacter sp.]|nr:hypothetical protein [Panacibacter sp.]
MRPQIILAFFVLVAAIFSCHRVYHIPDKDKKWLPYKGNETLVFADVGNNFDTVALMGFETSQVYIDSRPISPGEAEQIRLISLYNDSDTINDRYRKARSSLVFQSAGTQNNSFIGINFYAKNARFSPTKSYTPDYFDTATTITIATRLKKYDDVIILLPDVVEDSNFKYNQKANFISKLYWSKSDGIVRYDKNSNSWELVEKYGR